MKARARIYQRPEQNNHWYLDYSDPKNPGHRIREHVGPNKKDADIALAKIKVAQVEGRFLDVKRSVSMLFADMVERYMAWAKDNKKTWKDDQIMLGRFVKRWPGKLMTDIDSFMVQEYKRDRRKEHVYNAPGKLISELTVNHELVMLGMLFNRAAGKRDAICPPEEQFQGVSPLTGVRLFKIANVQRKVIFTSESRRRLLEACKLIGEQDYRAKLLLPVVQTALNTGMRREEILSLTWNNVNWHLKMLSIQDSKDVEKSRQIPMNAVVQQVFGDLQTKADLSGAKSGTYVFSKPGGGRYLRMTRSFMHALKLAGIEGFRFHDLRHVFASNVLNGGASKEVVGDLLGHSSQSVTDKYAHVYASPLKGAVDRMVDGADEAKGGGDGPAKG